MVGAACLVEVSGGLRLITAPRTWLLALLTRLGAQDLAQQLSAVHDVRELPDVRGAIVDVLGHEAASRGLSRDGTPNCYGDELDGLVEVLGQDDSDRFMTRRPRVVVLAGSNGAGKSTMAPVLLCGKLGAGEFVNADTIARGPRTRLLASAETRRECRVAAGAV
jgi:hypothetical protein